MIGTDDELDFPPEQSRPALQIEPPSSLPDDAAAGKRRQSAHSGAVPGSAGDQQQIGSQSDFDPEQLDRDKVGGESLRSSSPAEPREGIQKQLEAVREPQAPLQAESEPSEQNQSEDGVHSHHNQSRRINIDQDARMADLEAHNDPNPSPINLENPQGGLGRREDPLSDMKLQDKNARIERGLKWNAQRQSYQ